MVLTERTLIILRAILAIEGITNLFTASGVDVAKAFAKQFEQRRIHAIKHVRAITGWGLRESKDFVQDIIEAYKPNPEAEAKERALVLLKNITDEVNSNFFDDTTKGHVRDLLSVVGAEKARRFGGESTNF